MFGITHYDIEVANEIERHGYSVYEAYKGFRKGTLPEKLQRVIQNYEDSLKEAHQKG